MAPKKIKCTVCGSTDTVKQGKTSQINPRQRFFCKAGRHFFSKIIQGPDEQQRVTA